MLLTNFKPNICDNHLSYNEKYVCACMFGHIVSPHCSKLIAITITIARVRKAYAHSI